MVQSEVLEDLCVCEAVDDIINGDSVSSINNISIPNSVTSPYYHAIQAKLHQ